MLEESTRQIALYHLDRGWADHLAVLAEIREGIHLRALGHGPNPFIMALDPLAEFHAEAVKLFSGMFGRIEEQSQETFLAAEITPSGVDLEAIGADHSTDNDPPDALWSYPEVLRVDAELILHAESPGAEKKAEAKLVQSLDLARSQSLLSFELRSATSLARLWSRTKRVAKARNLLRETLDEFTEGFATTDMKQARQLLDHLS